MPRQTSCLGMAQGKAIMSAKEKLPTISQGKDRDGRQIFPAFCAIPCPRRSHFRISQLHLVNPLGPSFSQLSPSAEVLVHKLGDMGQPRLCFFIKKQ